jgi:hypothetical protein
MNSGGRMIWLPSYRRGTYRRFIYPLTDLLHSSIAESAPTPASNRIFFFSKCCPKVW